MLKTVDIPFCILLGSHHKDSPKIADVLPRSLVTLNFGEDAWWVDAFRWNKRLIVRVLTEFVEERIWIDATPELKDLNVSLAHENEVQKAMPEEDSEWLLYNGEKDFKHLCPENGLNCDVFPLPD